MHAGRTIGILAGAIVAVVGLAGCSAGPVSVTPEPKTAAPSTTPTPTAHPTPTASPAFNKTQFSIDDPSSIWVVVDKLRPMKPLDYAPPDLVDSALPHLSGSAQLRPAAAAALAAMFQAAAAEGAGRMQIQNAYRSYSLQLRVYSGWAAQMGKAKADIQSARPGYSEHQTGLTLDIASLPSTCELQECFGDTVQGRWLAANAYRFGYVLRYPQGKQAITGYIYEPWHFRYVGVALATELHDSHVATLEEFFGLPPAPDYPR